jgi:hypothetical protein
MAASPNRPQLVAVDANVLLPAEEINDSLLLAESGLLGCTILLSSDEQLRGIDFERLTLELQAFDVTPPIVATPREIVLISTRYFPRRPANGPG